MKYLNKYNEVNSYNIMKILFNEFKDFCNNYLASLIDEGFLIKYYYSDEVVEIEIRKPGVTSAVKSWYIWDDIKDHFIPFFIMLNRDYTMKRFQNHLKKRFSDDIKTGKYVELHCSTGDLYLGKKEIENDNVNLDAHILLITFKIKLNKL